MTEDERIEAALVALRLHQAWSSFWSGDDARKLIKTSVTAYLAGDVVVPREPTDEMADFIEYNAMDPDSFWDDMLKCARVTASETNLISRELMGDKD